MRKSEHIGCGCKQCRLGASTPGGQYTHRQVNRRIRHLMKSLLAKWHAGVDLVTVTVSTPYTD